MVVFIKKHDNQLFKRYSQLRSVDMTNYYLEIYLKAGLVSRFWSIKPKYL